MNLKRNVLLLGLASALWYACTPSQLDLQALNEYLLDEGNGLTVKQEAGNLNLKVTYRPNDLLVYQELDPFYDQHMIQKLHKKYEGYAYFVLSMETEGRDVLYGTAQGQTDFNERLQTLSFRMQELVSITTSARDTIPVADYVYPRNFGLAKSSTLLFAFNRERMKTADWLIFNLKEFGMRTGDQHFRFQVHDLEKTPRLVFAPTEG